MIAELTEMVDTFKTNGLSYASHRRMLRLAKLVARPGQTRDDVLYSLGLTYHD